MFVRRVSATAKTVLPQALLMRPSRMRRRKAKQSLVQVRRAATFPMTKRWRATGDRLSKEELQARRGSDRRHRAAVQACPSRAEKSFPRAKAFRCRVTRSWAFSAAAENADRKSTRLNSSH